MAGFGDGVIISGLASRNRNVFDALTGIEYDEEYNNNLYFESLESGI